MAGKRKNNPAGSTNNYRGDVLRVLGALKVATADQIQRIGAPHLTHRHADKETPSQQKQARTASHTGALSDMRKHGLAENGGSTETGGEAAESDHQGPGGRLLRTAAPGDGEMGSTARGAGSSGASHPMAVNETVIALLRPKPDMAKLAGDPPDVQAAAQAVVDAPDGVGTIASYLTEVPLPATGTWNAPGKGGAQADIVLTAPQDKVPLLFIEVDNCHETAEELADKLEKYARFLRRKMKDTDGKERPMWRTRWTAPRGRPGDVSHPPVLLVFNRIGDRNPNRTIPRLQELTRHLWQGERQKGGHHVYDGKIRCSPASAATTRSRSWKRSATPATKRPKPAIKRSSEPARRSTRHSYGGQPRSRRRRRRPSARPDAVLSALSAPATPWRPAPRTRWGTRHAAARPEAASPGPRGLRREASPAGGGSARSALGVPAPGAAAGWCPSGTA